jgi:deoxyuridine 5'-triphosphate nucleotidohydrolase
LIIFKETRNKNGLVDIMKIGVMHWAFPPVVGGVESHLVYLYEELAARGHKISLLTAPHPARDDKSFDWIKITSDNNMNLPFLQKAPVSGRYEKVYDMMERFITSENPDVIHAHNFHYFFPDHAECLDELSKKYDIPIVLTIHNYWEDDLCRHLMRDIGWNKIVAVSYHMKKPCIFDSRLDPAQVEVHYHGINLDKYAPAADVEIEPGHRVLVPTGIAVAIPEGYAGFVQPRSWLALRHGLSFVNTPGLIDSHYRGEIKVIAINLDPATPISIARGDKLAQLVIQPVARVRLTETDELDETRRGEGGFGSTGV